MNFDLQAKNYDIDRRVKRAQIIAEKILSYIIDGDKKSAMEYGCGTGLVGLQLADKFHSVLFMDSSQAMIDEVRQKIAGIQNASAQYGDLIKTSLPDLRFDYIFLSLVLHHIKDTETILTRFRELLNNDGRLLIVDLDKDDGRFHAGEAGFDGHHGFDQKELKDLLMKTGFQNVEIQTFYHGERENNGTLMHYSLFIVKAEK